MFYVTTLHPWDAPLPDTPQLDLARASENLSEILWRKARARSDRNLLLVPGQSARRAFKEALANTLSIYAGALLDGRSVDVYVTGVPCTSCGEPAERHAGEKCLYAPTVLSYDADWFPPQGAKFEGRVILKYET